MTANTLDRYTLEWVLEEIDYRIKTRKDRFDFQRAHTQGLMRIHDLIKSTLNTLPENDIYYQAEILPPGWSPDGYTPEFYTREYLSNAGR